MPFRKPRMLEILPRIMNHAKLLHHSPRTNILRNSKRDDALQPDILKTITNNLGSAFRRQSFSPILRGEPPADLDRRHKRCDERRNRQPDKADEGLLLTQLCCEESETMLLEVLLDTLNHLV